MTWDFVVLGILALFFVLWFIIGKGWLGERWLDKADKIAAIVSMVVGVLALTYQLLGDLDWNFGSGQTSLAMNQRTDVIRKEAALVLTSIHPSAQEPTATFTLERKGWQPCRLTIDLEESERFKFRDRIYELTVTKINVEDQKVTVRLQKGGEEQGHVRC